MLYINKNTINVLLILSLLFVVEFAEAKDVEVEDTSFCMSSYDNVPDDTPDNSIEDTKTEVEPTCNVTWNTEASNNLGDDAEISQFFTGDVGTILHEKSIIPGDAYDIEREIYVNLITGDSAYKERYILHEKSEQLEPHIAEALENIENIDHFKDFTETSRRESIAKQEIDSESTINDQKLANNKTEAELLEEQEKYLVQSDKQSDKKIIHEKDLLPYKKMRDKDLKRKVFDSDAVVKTVGSSPENFRQAIKNPLVEARLIRLKNHFEYKKNHHFCPTKRQKCEDKIKILDALISGKVTDLINQIQYADLPTAESAFKELKDLYTLQNYPMFLVGNAFNCENFSDFTSLIGIDAIGIASVALQTRQDFIAEHVKDPAQLIRIQKFDEMCIALQKNNDVMRLSAARRMMVRKITRNGIARKNIIDDICLALVRKRCEDPINTVFTRIKHAPLPLAKRELFFLEAQLLHIANQNGITNISDLQDILVKRYGFDALTVAHDFYKSRADYTSEQSIKNLPINGIAAVLSNIQNNSLQEAHIELISAQEQISKHFENNGIDDPVEQKEILEKQFDKDIRQELQKAYTDRSDYREIKKLFAPIDVQSSTAQILRTSNSYKSVANQMQDVANQVFGNVKLCGLENVSEAENQILDSLRVMHAPKNDIEFVINATITDHLLTDLQCMTDAIATGEPTVWEKSSEIVVCGMTEFIHRFNPYTQVTELGSVCYDVVSIIGRRLQTLATDPINATKESIETTRTIINFLDGVSRLTCDITTAASYISSKEGQTRISNFCGTANAVGTALEQSAGSTTAKDISKATGRVLGDIAAGKTFAGCIRLLKEIDTISKFSNELEIIANEIREIVQEHPAFATVEGLAVKMSDGIKEIEKPIKTVITQSRILLENTINLHLKDIISEAKRLREKFACLDCPKECLRRGFGKFKNGHIKIAYEHILGIELTWTKEGHLKDFSGLHHDFMNALEKSETVQFINKVIREDGCYIADVIIDGIRKPDKTFFPATWSQEKVAEKIYEAYENFVKSGVIPELNPQGKYFIDGYTNEGIKITMIVTQKGHMKTAYPSFK